MLQICDIMVFFAKKLLQRHIPYASLRPIRSLSTITMEIIATTRIRPGHQDPWLPSRVYDDMVSDSLLSVSAVYQPQETMTVSEQLICYVS
jgi:hypothetical protein